MIYSQSDQLNLKIHCKGNRKSEEECLNGSYVFSQLLKTTFRGLEGLKEGSIYFPSSVR